MLAEVSCRLPALKYMFEAKQNLFGRCHWLAKDSVRSYRAEALPGLERIANYTVKD